ncbi:hypothetical protein [Deinococcus hopiensis]|uniref:Uncharacterized protein n=1 Tax=Deinococcus hopiensis KR-140 TaxID=695939 RepID=A0A1W1VCT7_9DEIO|nr:hypothetical protein [Deinococcus hopiensis]SMB91135.1 hypothetical protein SAMN00790413_01002 [Deinococcus hopiensis KR-140]
MPGTAGFCVILDIYLHAHFTGREAPIMGGELSTAVPAMLGVHTLRGIGADRANAASGIAPVPVDPQSQCSG